MTQADTTAIEVRVEALDDKLDAIHRSLNGKLDKIDEKVSYTNGRVTELERQRIASEARESERQILALAESKKKEKIRDRLWSLAQPIATGVAASLIVIAVTYWLLGGPQ